MKKFSYLFLVVLIFALNSECYSQSFIVKAGMDFPNILDKDADGKLDTKMITGFQLGGSLEFPINDIFSFETGLQLLKKGTKQTYNTGGYYQTKVEGKLDLTYLDIPITAKVRYDLNGVKLYGVLGPYIGFGLGGQIYENGDGTKVEWGSDIENDDFKRFDGGLIIGGGVEINSIQIGLTYGLGLANISTNTDNQTIISHRVLGISVGYIFGRK